MCFVTALLPTRSKKAPNRATSGNALATPLAELLAGDDYRYMQDMLTGRAALRDDLPCVKCRMLPPWLRAR